MKISEYDRRQLSLMKERLSSFMSNNLSLKDLIDDLEGLLNCLESMNTEWKEVFHAHWFMLEQVYAVALFRNESINSDDPDILEAVKQLEALLNS